MKILPSCFHRARARLTRAKRGSVLMLTLLIVVGLTYIIATLLSSTVTEMKLNQRAQLSLEAKNAVESATEYAITIVRQKFDNYPNMTGNYFITNPVTIPASISGTLWNGTDVSPGNVTVTVGLIPTLVQVYIDPSNPANAFDPDRGKIVTASDVYVYASATAANGWGRQTAYGSQALEVRNSPLFTNAIFYNMDLEFHPGAAMTISGPIHCNGNIWAVSQAALTFSGPITTSGNFNVGLIPWPTNWGSSTESAQTGTQVYIPNTNGGYTTPYIGGNLSTSVSSSYWDSRQTNYSNTTYTNWREMSANLWGGNLQDSANGVPSEQVTGYNNYVFAVNGTTQDLDYAYSIIQPAQSSYYANGTANPWNLQTGETDKFERNASIIVKVLAMGTANITQTITADTNGNTAVQADLDSNITGTVSNFQSSGNLNAVTGQQITGSVQYHNGTVQSISGNTWTNYYASSNPNAVLLVTQNQQSTTTHGSPALLTGTSSGNLMELPANITGNSTLGAGNTTRYVGFAVVEFDTVETSLNATTNTLQPVYNGSTAVTDAAGDVTYPGDVIINPIQVNTTALTGNNLLWFQPGVGNMEAVSSNTATPGVANSAGYGGNITDIWSGMYDGRRAATISTLNLNVGALKSFVDNNSPNYANYSAALFNGTGNLAYNASNQYNGVVYVEFPELPGNTTRLGNATYTGDDVLTSTGGNLTGFNVGLVLYNGTSSNVTANTTTTGVPNPNYANTTEGTAGRTSGFSVSTNNCVYIEGSYNADGNINTPKTDNSAANTTYNDTMPDSGNLNNPDPVCLVAGDSVTCLSGNWISRVGEDDKIGAASYAYPVPATATEINTAIMGGIMPSTKYSSTNESGGAHNFPRFLENWGSVTFRYRGSMVCLYESEIADQPYSTNYYGAPTREWGYYQEFANGIYPPGTPSARDYYRVNFSYLTAAAYTTAINGL